MAGSNVQPQPIHTPQYVMVPTRESNGLGVLGFLVSLIGLVIPTGLVALLGFLISLIAVGRPPRGFATVGLLLGLIGTVVWFVIDILVLLGLVAGAVVGAGFLAAGFMMTQPEVVELTTDMSNIAIAAQERMQREAEDSDDDDDQQMVMGLTDFDLDQLDLNPAMRIDPWGHRYRIVVREQDAPAADDDDNSLSTVAWQPNSSDRDQDPQPGKQWFGTTAEAPAAPGVGQAERSEQVQVSYDIISAGPDGEFNTDDDIAFTRLDEVWEQAFSDFGPKMKAFGERMESLDNNSCGSACFTSCEKTLTIDYSTSVKAKDQQQERKGGFFTQAERYQEEAKRQLEEGADAEQSRD